MGTFGQSKIATSLIRPGSLLAILLLLAESAGLAHAQTNKTVKQSDLPEATLPTTTANPFEVPKDDIPAEAPYSAYQQGHYLTAFLLATELAGQGDVAAQTLLGELYNRGEGVSQDHVEAAKWFELAADNGDREAQFALGLLHAKGQGVAKDEKKAAHWFEKAAEQGQKDAQFNLAYLYLEGRLYRQDLNKAIDLFTKSAEQGLADAQYALASLYKSDFYPTPDLRQSAHWMQKAAESGFADAQLEFGLMLFNGKGVDQNQQAGIGWLEQAAKQGSILAQNRLARIYARGIGTKEDPIRAGYYYLQSRKSGKLDEWLDGFYQGLNDAQKSAIQKRVTSNSVW